MPSALKPLAHAIGARRSKSRDKCQFPKSQALKPVDEEKEEEEIYEESKQTRTWAARVREAGAGAGGGEDMAAAAAILPHGAVDAEVAAAAGIVSPSSSGTSVRPWPSTTCDFFFFALCMQWRKNC